MSPFRAGDENAPVADQLGRRVGLRYEPVGGLDADDSGDSWLNVHFDVYDHDMTDELNTANDVASLKKEQQLLREKRAANTVEERSLAHKLASQSKVTFLQALQQLGLKQELATVPEPDSSKRAKGIYIIPPSITWRSPVNNRLLKQLEARDDKWKQKNSGVLDQGGFEVGFEWLDTTPADVMAPITVEAARARSGTLA